MRPLHSLDVFWNPNYCIQPPLVSSIILGYCILSSIRRFINIIQSTGSPRESSTHQSKIRAHLMWSCMVHPVQRSLNFCLFWIYSKTLSASNSIGSTILCNGVGYSIEIRPSYVFLIGVHLEPPCILYVKGVVSTMIFSYSLP